MTHSHRTPLFILVIHVIAGMLWLPFAFILWLVAFLVTFLIRRLMSPRRLQTPPRQELKQELEKFLLPAIKAAGFDGPAAFKGHELVFDFHRRQGEGHHFLTIQFEKRRGPEFRLNFYADAGPEIEMRQRPMVENSRDAALPPVLVAGKRSGTMTPGRIFYWKSLFWFSSRGPYILLGAWLRGANPAEVVARQAAHLFQTELEPWWDQKKTGPHLNLNEQWGDLSKPRNLKAKAAHCFLWIYMVYGLLLTGMITFFLLVEPLVLIFRLAMKFIF